MVSRDVHWLDACGGDSPFAIVLGKKKVPLNSAYCWLCLVKIHDTELISAESVP